MILRKCVIPAFAGKVSAAVLKLILINLGDHIGDNPECWQSQDTIVEETGIGKRQVQRGIAALQSMNLILSRRTQLTNRYQIVWNELKLLVPAVEIESTDGFRCATSGASENAPGEFRRATSGGSGRATSGGSDAPPVAHKATKKRPLKRPPPGGELDAAWLVVVEEFQSKQAIARELAEEHLARNFTPAEFRAKMLGAWETAEMPENADKLVDKAASVQFYLRRGSWPCAGIVDAHVLARQRATKAAAAERETVERAKHLRAEAEAQRLRELLQQREENFGPLLDRLDREQLRDLIDLAADLSDFQRDAAYRATFNPPPTGYARSTFLETLEACGATAEDFFNEATIERTAE